MQQTRLGAFHRSVSHARETTVIPQQECAKRCQHAGALPHGGCFPVGLALILGMVAADLCGNGCPSAPPATRQDGRVWMVLGGCALTFRALLLLPLTPVSTAVSSGGKTTTNIPIPVGAALRARLS